MGVVRPITPSLGAGWATHNAPTRRMQLPTITRPASRSGEATVVKDALQQQQEPPQRPTAVVKAKRFVPPMVHIVAPAPNQPKAESPPIQRPSGGEWSEWIPNMSYGFRPGYNGVKTKHFPKSAANRDTAWNLPAKSVRYPDEAKEKLVEAEAHKLEQFTHPWSSDKKGNYKPPEGAGISADPLPQKPIIWDDVQAIVRRECCSLLVLDILDSDGKREGRAHKVMIWIVDATGQMEAHETIVVDEVFGGAGEMSLERTTAKMDDSLRIFGRAVLRKLYNLCINPVEEALRGKRNLIIVPSGPLCFVPWAALMNRTGHYLCEAHAIRVVPHLHLMHTLHHRAPAPRLSKGGSRPHDSSPPLGPRCVVLGNPMPLAPRFGKAEDRDGELLYAGAEVQEAVSALMRTTGGVGGVRTMMEEECTKDKVMASVRDAEWVHVAAHVEDNMLLLAVDDGAGGAECNDGVMGCDEMVARLRLAPGCTVVLSACNVSMTGPSMFELCRAFVSCGASTVLISMWSLVDESTSALMRRVYRGLAGGKDLAEALRFAGLQLAGRQFGEEIDPWDNPATPYSMLPYSRPLHWSGLIVVGSSPRLPGMSKPSSCLSVRRTVATCSPRAASSGLPDLHRSTTKAPEVPAVKACLQTQAANAQLGSPAHQQAQPQASNHQQAQPQASNHQQAQPVNKPLIATAPAALGYQMWGGRTPVLPRTAVGTPKDATAELPDAAVASLGALEAL